MRFKLLSAFPQLAPLAPSTISLAIKNQLGYRYRRINKLFLPAATSRIKEHSVEAARILQTLYSYDKTPIYIDEFSINNDHIHNYGWVKKGCEGIRYKQLK
jgi:hypothetical protein